MRKFKVGDILVLPTESIGTSLPVDHTLKGSIKRKTKVGAVKIQDGFIQSYKKCIDSSKPRVYTVEQVTEETFRLFQIGTYEHPIIFRMDGTTISDKRNWGGYKIILLGGR